jgi:hypothetical protein
MYTLKHINQSIKAGLTTSAEWVGESVKIGFLTLTIDSENRGYWYLSRGKAKYEFVPYSGLVRLN